MTSLPLELHEVMEQEYVAMYGPIAGRPPVHYDSVVDERWAVQRLRDCLVWKDGDKNVVDVLNELVDGKRSVTLLINSPELTDEGKVLIENYETYTDGVPEERKKELNRRIVDEAIGRSVKSLRDLRLNHVYKQLHAKDDNSARSALCISGGGIRSATFALGVIQGLASGRILDKFDYLSTVSGGGYIGSWLSSWARRHPDGITGVQEDLVRADTATGHKDLRPESKIEPEPHPMRHLREYSNYLSPRLGLTSADTWTMVALYLRNLMLNLLIIVPVLAFLLAIPRLFAYFLNLAGRENLDGLIALSLAGLAFGFGYIGAMRPVAAGARADHKRRRTTDGKFLGLCVFPLLVAAVSLSLFWAEASQATTQATLADFTRWRTGGLAIFLMTVWPAAIYYVRYFRASSAVRGDSAARRKHFKRHALRKLAYETGGAFLGVFTAATLLYVIATSLFPNPLQDVPRTAELLPFLRPLENSIPWAELYVCLAVPLVMAVFYVQASVFVGISGKVNEDQDREWWGRAGAWLLIVAGAVLFLCGIAVFGPVALYSAPAILGVSGAGAGGLAAVLGFSDKTAANKKEKENAGKAGMASNIGLALAVPIFVVIFLAAIALGTTWAIQKAKNIDIPKDANFAAQFAASAKYTLHYTIDGKEIEAVAEAPQSPALTIGELRSATHLQTVHDTGWKELAAIAGVFILAVGLSYCIGVNKFSMHALYRNRLIRAYLGASRHARQPEDFTGFDENDNLQMYELRPELLWATSITDSKAFLATIRATPAFFAKLDDVSKDTVERDDATPHAMRALVQNVNSIIDDPQVDFGLKTWASDGYSHAYRNRAAIDQLFAGSLKPMQPPKGAAVVAGDASAPKLTLKEPAPKPANPPMPRAPLHVINTALNLVSGQKLAWQQRKAESFTVTPYHSGNLFLGYRDSKEYGGPSGISIGTAVAISGAAASPNMGYHSSPAMAFLLSIFNVRLGWWLGNTGIVGESAYTEAHPASNLAPLLKEVTGSTNDTYEWVYLSDGGHFENLGIYEMVLRRCRHIVVSDAGADPSYSFEDLGNAIRKIRIDFGIPIEITSINRMFPRKPDNILQQGQYVAVAKIRYSAVDDGAPDGTLVYIKPGLYEHEYFPRDVYNYASASTDFPHESTADQFFSESQFESYRALGRHVISEICGWYPANAGKPFCTIAEFVKRASETAQPAPTASASAPGTHQRPLRPQPQRPS